jgi:hypothetical protein
MIWLSISLLLCAILICCTILLVNFEKEEFCKAVSCLEDLCDTLNEKFPGSDLKVTDDKYGVKVKGELKYLIKNDN